MPISIFASLNNRSEIHLGVVGGLLMQTHNKVNIVKTGDQNSNEILDQNGYLDAYKSCDLSMNLGYGYWISQRFKLQLSGKLGLVDISKNNVFRSNSINKVNAISIGLHYKIW